MTRPQVSVCIRGWRRDTLPEAIASVLRQGHDVEVIVGDDAGDLQDVVTAFGDPRVRYRRNGTRLGLSSHARTLLNEARGRYVKLLDDDDRLLPGYMDATVARLDDDPAVGIVFTNFFHEAAGRLHERSWPLAGGRHDHFLPDLLRGCPIGLSGALMRREVWEEGERSHPVRDDASVEMTMWMRAAEGGWAFHYVDERLVAYRVHAGQASHDEDLLRGRTVRVFEDFRFDDPACERLRRRRLAEALLARANLRLRQRRPRAALRDARAAFEVAPAFGEREVVALLGARHGAAKLLAEHPRLVTPAFAAWRALQRLDRFG